ncbi:Hypothetical predicted protein [Octopus vulgaris]|uniref:Uncharacterized protein n=1 Tax=Octopus vulgaris TaxID=6645 RepID=A0AA36B303_OCTVU|nr:Hypothetical predicted protein [Octopus vulgaris]
MSIAEKRLLTALFYRDNQGLKSYYKSFDLSGNRGFESSVYAPVANKDITVVVGIVVVVVVVVVKGRLA